ncbi:hypothetical protein Poli38472_010164 [Pythium oligandrum]|uniref:Uncharacterized protein n=1 Tax=Pythium oligandrum TaxID=41045 RepID=A0A8K1FCR6_PYTOL|nr:hypothetical protein Poli38472_010164 [Pythium oligandrum]|eukprot:TMW58605.1 hypothetical protein Poli38472_010164 [Pythium oligandrum]
MEALGRTGSEVSMTAFDGFRATTEWKEWDFDCLNNLELDLGLDSFLMANDFIEPLGATTSAPVMNMAAVPAQDVTSAMSTPVSPPVFDDLMETSCSSESEMSSIADDELLAMASLPKRSRKRKIPQTYPTARALADAKPVVTPKAANDKKIKMTAAQQKAMKKREVAPLSAEAERLYRRRYDILHEILEAWNTGGIEDMEEIADDVYDEDVTLISPDYSEGLKGAKALMHHWGLLLDSFPDGIMEEYNIERDDPEGQKMNVSWIFSGTQIFPFFGVEPRHEKVTIRGQSFFTFKGEKISQMVLSWNYREAMMKLMGLKAPSEDTPRR